MRPRPEPSHVDDPNCKHRSHHACVSCRRLFCARCGVELAESTNDWKVVGFWCEDCLSPKPAVTSVP